MGSIVNEISTWISTLPYWEQAAFEKVISGTSIGDEDYDKLLDYLLEDAGLIAPSETPRPTLTFSQPASASDLTTGKALRLGRISKLRNVNALVPDQELTFGPALTAIFGANGSGKSGYARVIASAAFTRGDKQVLRDISQPATDGTAMSAEIELTDGQESYTLSYEVGSPCQDMHCFYVFDSTSVRAHLMHSNAMSFSPGGLSYLTRLADVTDEVRKRLQVRVDQRTRRNPLTALFPAESTVGKLVQALGASTDLESVRRLGTLTTDEEAQIVELDLNIAKLKSENVAEQAADVQQAIHDLRRLVERLAVLERELGTDKEEAVRAGLIQWRAADDATRNLSFEQFRADWFKETGGDPWQDFVAAAHTLARVESTADQPYPQPGSHCLLCHQLLSPEAIELLRRLWAFLESTAQDDLAQAEAVLNNQVRTLAALEMEFLSDETVAYRHLHRKDSSALQTAQTFVNSCRQRRDLMVSAISQHSELALSPLPDSARDEVTRVIAGLQAELDELNRRDPAREIADLDAQKLSLEHRRMLGQQLAEIERYVEDCKWIARVIDPKVRRSTRHISTKYNQLFSQLVTEQYLQLFAQLLKELNCPRHVRVQTRGQKGETVKQIVLETHESIPVDQAPPEKVLSEGEQRAVALADFLTEVALDDSSTGVILDDPVSSLDFEWKETIARHLVAEAERRQVIVFTHDLHFLHCLKAQADQRNITLEAHWIERRDGRPGWVFLGNSPLSEKDYKTSAKPRQIYEQAKDPALPSDQQQTLLQLGFGALRTCYEAFVIFDLFGNVVMRWGERVSIDRLKGVAIEPAIRDEVIEKVGLLSRYIEGHLHSDTFAAQKPTPEMLNQEIQQFEALKKRHKDYLKSLGVN